MQHSEDSITRKLTWMNMLVSGAALLLACGAFVAYQAPALREALVRTLSMQAQIVGSNSISAVLFNDPKAAQDTLSALKSGPSIRFAAIYTPDGKPFATYSRNSRENLPSPAPLPAGETETYRFDGGEVVLVRAIQLEGRTVSLVSIRSGLQEINGLLRRNILIGAAVLLVSLGAALLVSSIFRRGVADPILRLAETARAVSRESNYSVRAAATGGRDEIADLIGAFNEMLAQIQKGEAEVRRLNEELEHRVFQRTAELQESNKELEAFTYSVAHDLRAPLRHIQGFSKILVEDFSTQMPADAQDCLRDIADSTRHMGHLIDDLLSLARVGRQELVHQVTGLGSLVGEVKEELRRDTNGREIQWQLGDLPFVECDPGLMKQVFYNLLSNAVKYTRPRKPAVIETGQTTSGDGPVIFVKDNGVGFNMQHSAKLFGVFQRLHRREDFEGTGVGLATVQRIIHKHGGRIWAEAELDRGATFFFQLGAPASGGTH